MIASWSDNPSSRTVVATASRIRVMETSFCTTSRRAPPCGGQGMFTNRPGQAVMQGDGNLVLDDLEEEPMRAFLWLTIQARLSSCRMTRTWSCIDRITSSYGRARGMNNRRMDRPAVRIFHSARSGDLLNRVADDTDVALPGTHMCLSHMTQRSPNSAPDRAKVGA